MRERTLPELLRDSRAGAILIAELHATALQLAIKAAAQPLQFTMVGLVKWAVVLGRFDNVGFIYPMGISWFFVAGLLLQSVMLIAVAYLIAAWIYVPRKRTPLIEVAVSMGEDSRNTQN